VKPAPFQYHVPSTLADAVALKAQLGGEASLLAGGQSLVPMLNMRLARPGALIDLNRIPELSYVRVDDRGVAVGAMTRHRQLERSDEAQRANPLLREALGQVAHTIVRNRGTIGGSIAHADPAAELPSVLVALGGEVTATGTGGTRQIAAADLFEFHFTTTLAPDEILTEIWFPALPAGAGTSFLEISRRHGDYALAGVACLVTPDGVRMCFTGVGPRPMLVEGDDPDAAAEAVQPSDDIHATAAYRRDLVGVLARRAVDIARERAGASR
jgi:carbon-monoxide dehydrogenase medium subunit